VNRPHLDFPRTLTGLTSLAWLVLPFTVGDLVAVALTDRSTPVQWVVAVGCWAGWALGAGLLVVPRTTSLTGARFLVPAALLVAVAAAIAGDGVPNVAGLTGLAAAAVAAAFVLTSGVGDRAVNGSSYGAERRFALRPPAAVVAGPLPLLWVVVVVGVGAGPLLLASRQWVAGGAALILGWALATLIVRRVHVLSRRWLVMVPAGLVVHDPLVLTDSLLVQRANLASVGPAPADTTAMDLTMGALGLGLEVRLRTQARLLTNAARRAAGGSFVAPGDEVTAVLVAASRPGAVMRTAQQRRLPVS
jgi:hypothetical protein